MADVKTKADKWPEGKPNLGKKAPNVIKAPNAPRVMRPPDPPKPLPPPAQTVEPVEDPAVEAGDATVGVPEIAEDAAEARAKESGRRIAQSMKTIASEFLNLATLLEKEIDRI